MPELAEVEYFRKQWNPGLGGKVEAVRLHEGKRVFRDLKKPRIQLDGLRGSILEDSRAHGKNLLFHFRRDKNPQHLWLGVHLGMTGKLRTERKAAYAEDKHDHFVIVQAEHVLVFNDYRLFGKITFDQKDDDYHPPEWWQKLPPEVLSSRFSLNYLSKILERRGKAPIKAVLLMQEFFPGLGNWLVDEILWQAGIDPRRPAGSLKEDEVQELRNKIRSVSRGALKTIGEDWRDPPKKWMVHERWSSKKESEKICPQTKEPLRIETVGGRTTYWSPAIQK